MAYFELIKIAESTSVYNKDVFMSSEGYETNYEYIQIQKVREEQEDKWGLASGVFANRWYLVGTKHGVLYTAKTKKEVIKILIYYTASYANKNGGCL